MKVPNIYENKNYKRYFIVPVALLLISLYFIPHIQLDSSLRGGITITLQSNTTADQRTMVSAIDAAIPGAESTIARAPGGISITIASNASISNAESYLLKGYLDYGNYTQETVIVTGLTSILKNQPGNSTIISELNAAKSNQSAYASQLDQDIGSEFASINTFIPNQTYNTTSPLATVNSGKDALTRVNNIYETRVITALKSIIPFTTYSYQTVTATLSSYFLGQVLDIIIVSFIVVGIVTMLVFRNIIPSLTVVFGAAADLIIALGAMGAFGIPLGIASIGGLLMLIGYSMDTDILAAIKILKRHEGTPEARAYSTLKTGLTMTSTAVIVFAILFIVSYISFIPTYFEISGVVLAGLIGDIVATWMGNTVLVLWYKKRKDEGK